MTATLKSYLGDAGALSDDSMGLPSGCRLYDVLVALAEGGAQVLTQFLATPAVQVLNAMVVNKATRLKNLRMHVGTTGTAGSTTCRVLKNGVAVTGATLTIANTDDDGSQDSVDLDVAVAAGDVLSIDLSAIPTAGANVTVTALCSEVTVE